MDFRKICRCCLRENDDMLHLFDLMEFNCQKELISNVFYDCFNLELLENNGLPKNICVSCVDHLKDAYTFKAMVQSSWTTLAQFEKNIFNATDDNDTIDSCELDDQLIVTTSRDEPWSPSSNNNIYNCNRVDDVDVKQIDILYKEKTDIPQSIESKEAYRFLYCTVCMAKFTTRQNLYRHCDLNHLVEKLHGKCCDYCNDKYDDYRTLIAHRKKHFTPYVCQLCWKGFITEFEFNSHEIDCHKAKNYKISIRTESPGEFNPRCRKRQCHICGKSFSMDYLNFHILIHSEGKYKCDVCGKKFKQPNSLSSHIKWSHKKEKQYPCHLCDNSFITSSARSSHIRCKHLKEKNRSCSLCSKQFFSTSDLRRHMLSHSGKKNFACMLCEKEYVTKYAMQIHFKTHGKK